MPTYEYECKECSRLFELFQSIKARPVRTIECECSECNNRAPVTRLIGMGGGVLFKGKGFYQTDYRSESYKKGAKAEADLGKSDTSKSDTGKSDSGKSDTGKADSGKSDTKGKTETSGGGSKSGQDAVATKKSGPSAQKGEGS